MPALLSNLTVHSAECACTSIKSGLNEQLRLLHYITQLYARNFWDLSIHRSNMSINGHISIKHTQSGVNSIDFGLSLVDINKFRNWTKIDQVISDVQKRMPKYRCAGSV